jgi:hypothetical protein
MAVLDFPEDIAPVQVGQFDLLDPSATYQDPRTMSALRQKRSTARWAVSFTWQNLTPTKWKRLMALRAKLKGSVNSVRLFDYSDIGANGTLGNNLFDDDEPFDDGFGFDDDVAVVLGNTLAGSESILIIAAQSPKNTVLVSGDKIGTPNDRLYLVLDDADTDALGRASVSISPPLLEDLADGTPIVTYRPTERFFMTAGTEPIPRSLEKLGNVTIAFTQEPRP